MPTRDYENRAQGRWLRLALVRLNRLIGSSDFADNTFRRPGQSSSAQWRTFMSRNRYRVLLTAFVLALSAIPACSTTGRIAEQVATSPPPARPTALIFPPAGALAYSRTNDGPRDWPAGATIPWEITKTQSGGRTRVSAVRHDGGGTEYYTSSSGPNGSTGRRRVVSRSTNIPHGHQHRP